MILIQVFDAHCDLLMKLFEDPSADFDKGTGDLQVTRAGLEKGHVKVQIFAIYIPDAVHPSMRFEAALAQVDLFYRKVIKQAGLKQIKSKQDILSLQENEIGAILALEGCDVIGDDLLKLRTLFHLGVRSVGLTWNHPNLVADGAGEPRGGGLTQFGQEVVNELNAQHMFCDVSHLSEKGFWDVITLAEKPVATHSNSRALIMQQKSQVKWPLARSLSDEQFIAIAQRNGVVGVTFVPDFLTTKPEANVDDVLRHIEHYCSLGGQKHIGIGADFDGIQETPIDLRGPQDFGHLQNELLKRYSEGEVADFLYNNFVRIF